VAYYIAAVQISFVAVIVSLRGNKGYYLWARLSGVFAGQFYDVFPWRVCASEMHLALPALPITKTNFRCHIINGKSKKLLSRLIK
jgi:hypothetical protein